MTRMILKRVDGFCESWAEQFLTALLPLTVPTKRKRPGGNEQAYSRKAGSFMFSYRSSREVGCNDSASSDIR